MVILFTVHPLILNFMVEFRVSLTVHLAIIFVNNEPDAQFVFMYVYFDSLHVSDSCVSIVTLPVVLYGCETWSFSLREDMKLRVFDNMVLRRIFGPRKNEVTGEWRRLHNVQLNNLYCSPNIVRVIKSRRMRCAGHVARMGEERGVYRVLVGKQEGKRPLERPRRRWVDNIRMDLQEVVCGYMDWIGLAQDRDRWWTLVSAVMNIRVP